MTSERDELETDLRAVYQEIHPHRDMVHVHISEDVLALGVLIRRELKIRRCPTMFARGTEPQPTARSKKKR